MGWDIGFDTNWQRDVGYGVPSKCDHPGCDKDVDRGLGYVCADQEPYGGEHGCGLFFCEDHSHNTEDHTHLCLRCLRGNKPYQPKPDVPKWIKWKLDHESWQACRDENPEKVEEMKKILAGDGGEG